ncbi:hypothetical protein EV197_0289 [Aquimarina brevivitae]|uniref:Uncharacterized protein n=1 Tax=Aquimarina brevivitae TaxID=323412 RepID=A0A4Q7PFI0_9FLAO|nr:hypothetical protein EV197_0289 [Aquimarina brevivitae]
MKAVFFRCKNDKMVVGRGMVLIKDTSNFYKV